MPRRHTNTPHQRFKLQKPCAKKRRFKSEAEALRALELASLHDLSLTLRTYHCPYCNNWHLSSSKEQT